MARVSTYLLFPGNAEEALQLYASTFGTEIAFIQRFDEMPTGEGMPPVSDADKNLILHAELPILAGHVLMATDAMASMGQTVRVGNNATISIEPDSRDEVDRLFAALSAGSDSSEQMPPSQMFWGAYWGVTLDRFNIRWMFNYPPTDG